MKTTIFRVVILGVLMGCCSVQPANAQFTETNIAWAKRATTNIYFPDDTTTNFRIKGRITSPNFSTNLTAFYIQDTNDNAGIYIYSAAFLVDTNTFKVGMEAQVTDKITQTNGITAISPQLGTRLVVSDATVIPVNPVLYTVTNLLAAPESFESQFVIITNVTVGTNWPAWGSSMSVTITDVTGSLTMRIDRSTDIDGQPGPTNAFDVKGIFTQFDTTTNANSGYQIQPRYYTDIIQYVGQQPPAVFVATTNYTATVDNPISISILGQDRNAADTLTLTCPLSPGTSTFTDSGNREGLFSWTPAAGDLTTTNLVDFAVSDGTVGVTTRVQIIVRALSGGPGYAWINEFHYDNASTDTNEGVELAGITSIDLTNYYLLFYDSGSGNSYYSNACTGVIDDEGHGYGAVWQPIAGSTIQNGPADGIALVHRTIGLLQFISYEGAMTANNGAAAGITSIDTGVSEQGTEPIGLSLQLQGNGTNYEAFTWSGPMTSTYGELNGSGQIIIGPVNAKLTCANLALSPAKPAPGSPFDIQCDVVPNYSASNIVATAWYRINAGGWTSIGMTDLGGYTNKTSSQIPAQTNGTPIDYYVSATFQGPNAVSPSVSVTNSAVIQSFPPVIAPLTNKTIQVSNTLSFAVSATEPDGDTITLTASNLPLANANFYPTNGVSASAGSFVFTPDVSQVGVYTASFYAVDKDGAVFSNVVITVNPQGYFIDFESESKGSYGSATIALSGLNWDMTDSLIGNLASDRKIGNWSARFRTLGSMTMLTDKINGCGTISFKYGRYGTDAVTTGKVEYSTDGGTNWTQVGSEFTASATNPMSDFSATISQTGGVRMRIIKISGSSTARFNVDNILMTDYSAPSGGDVDGIPSSWWDRYGIASGDRLATNNPDGDPDSNYEEFVADTDPTNNASYFVYEVTNMTGRGELQLLVGPPTTNSRVYDAFYNTNLVTGPWTPYNFNVPGAADGSSFFLTVTNDADGRFYRTGVKVP